MPRRSNYDKFPFVAAGAAEECSPGWDAIAARLSDSHVLCIECYPGVLVQQAMEELCARLELLAAFLSEQCLKTPQQLHAMLDPVLGTDRVFGRMNGIGLVDYFDAAKLKSLSVAVEHASRQGPVMIIGAGAALVAPPDATLVYADMARWEIQMRWRRGEIGNLGLENAEDDGAAKYKCGFFAEWRAADRLKKTLLPKIDYLLDTNQPQEPKLIGGEAFRAALKRAVQQPFRVVPYFDPGPWGGHWMEEVCDLPRDVPNHAWCFDCVPEENSLLLGFGEHRVEVPAIDIVFSHPRELLGEAVHARFGTEFPIRFDFLDTMGGGNLSLQVHPLTEYIQDKFGMNYTQDESYYILDAGEGATVYLGLKDNISREEMIADLLRAQDDGEFPAEKYVNRWPAKKHDHFLIPAGTIHCSGAESMVLEISATPYIFTFKLWDWGRLGLDGSPRPIHIEHGVANIQWDRTTNWTRRELINRFETVTEVIGRKEERTGLHEREFIETRRHWFTGAAPHHTRGGVNVLNLVEGDEAIVESPSRAFEPFTIHYAETFIVPASVGAYTIRPCGASDGKQCATVKAYVRTGA
jgi:mannose-6-phosphate isomerase class I